MVQTRKKWMALIIAAAMAFSVIGLGLSTESVSAASKKAPKPKKIYLKATSKRVDIKGKVRVSVKSVRPKNASKKVRWKSSNPRIARVSKNGVVTGKRTGKVRITATSKRSKRVKKTITIRVKKMTPRVKIASKATAYTGVKKTVKATVGPKGVYNKGVRYKSSNRSIATVSSKGVITPKKKGTVTITAYSKENKKYRDKCRVTVRQSITGMKFAAASKEMKRGTTTTNALTISPSNPYSKAVTYTSSNQAVATVNASGTVTAVAPGTATITATAKYGAKKTASYKVTVYDVLNASNGTYTLDESKYSSYRISAVREGKPASITLTPADIDNLFGNGNAGFDWSNAMSVRDNFPKAAFNYNSGNDYIFSKSGNKVTIKFSDDVMRTSWYYVPDKSFVMEGNGYTLTLFQMADGTGEQISLTMQDNTLKAGSDTKGVTLEKNGDTIEVTATARGTTVNATLRSVSATQYTVSFDPSYISKYQVEVKAYK